MHIVKAIFCRIFTVLKKIILTSFSLGKISFGTTGIIGADTHFSVEGRGKICVGKNIGTRRRCEFIASESGRINIGNNVFFNNACMVVAHESITIGDNTKFGPEVLIYDHDYDFKNKDNYMVGKHVTSPIVIGKNCWIGAGTIILRGTQIGDNCVIGAGAILKGIYKNNSLVIQKKEEIQKIIDKG